MNSPWWMSTRPQSYRARPIQWPRHSRAFSLLVPIPKGGDTTVDHRAVGEPYRRSFTEKSERFIRAHASEPLMGTVTNAYDIRVKRLPRCLKSRTQQLVATRRSWSGWRLQPRASASSTQGCSTPAVGPALAMWASSSTPLRPRSLAGVRISTGSETRPLASDRLEKVPGRVRRTPPRTRGRCSSSTAHGRRIPSLLHEVSPPCGPSQPTLASP